MTGMNHIAQAKILCLQMSMIEVFMIDIVNTFRINIKIVY